MDARIAGWLSRYSVMVLRVGLGIVFLWFGVLKFFPGMSPAQDLAIRTIDVLSLGAIPAGASIVLLATLECTIGLGLIAGKFMRFTLLLLSFQMLGAWLPLLLFPGEAFTQVPYAPTLEGQYIIKNVVLVGAGLVIGATVRGGRMTAAPKD
ncbi:DoxX family membrane protein (plasmid) [Rubrobacter marinus]|uniref:DoxX family membrane protein n=1 Tax=Rubrobacter marinus TaxID=2653852 RepID=A0A6G8Q3L7_9ACTN|nr:DoxX family protein [Rubrobacter marinus]QIN81049.1 DoxX family membrane protein [Rubrobacter marinus]